MRKDSKHKLNYRGSPTERFWKYVKKTDYCWNWTGASKTKGYGTLMVNNKNVGVHRFSYELHKGKIPKGYDYHGVCVLHKCDNTKCVNPEHLFLGSNADNVRDMVKKMRNTLGEKNGMSKLTTEQVKEIKRLQKEKFTGVYIAKLFNVGQTIISQIKTGTRWGHLWK